MDDKKNISDFTRFLFSKIESGSSVVFPSYETKREFLYSYVEYTDKAIGGNSVLAYDEFRSIFLSYNGKRKIRSFEQEIFLKNLLSDKNNVDILKPFYNSIFSESISIAAKNLSLYIKDLKRIIEDKNIFTSLDEHKQKAILFLYQNYITFLDKYNLSESYYEELDVLKILANKIEFLLFLPQLNASYKSDEKFLEQSKCIKIFDFKTDNFSSLKLPPIVKYNNVDEEIRGTLRHISYLLKRGVNASDIIITFASGDEKAISRFLSLSSIYDVNVNYSKNYDAKDTNQIFKFFYYISNIVKNNAYIFDVETLFTLSKLKWKIDVMSLYLYFVNHSFENVDETMIDNEEYRAFWNGLCKSLSHIVSASSYDAFYLALKDFTLSFLSYDEKGFDVLFKDALNVAFTLDKSEVFNANRDDFYTLFLSILEDELSLKKESLFHNYSILKSDKNVIKAYDYDSFYFQPCLYNFVLFGTQDSVKKEIRNYSVISDFENEKLMLDNQVLDITEDVFSLHKGFSVNLIASYSENNYSGFALSPNVFTSKINGNSEISYLENFKIDADYAEKKLYQNYMNFNNDCVGENSKLLFNNTFSHINDNYSISYKKDDYSLSATALKDLDDCPFKWCLTSFIQNPLNANDEKRRVSPLPYDKEGLFFHKAIEIYCKSKNKAQECDNYTFLASIYDSLLSSPPYSTFFPKRVLPYVETVDKEKFLSILDSNAFIGLSFNSSEMKIEDVVDGVKVKGYIDAVFTDSECNYVIVDYKRSSSSVPSQASFSTASLKQNEAVLSTYQVPFYILLLERKTQGVVVKFTYYAFLDAKKRELPFKNTEKTTYLTFDEMVALTRKSIVQKDAYIKNGEFEAKGKKCLSCAYKRVCRARFM